MNVIARSTLQAFWQRHADAEEDLKAWYHEAHAAHWRSAADIKQRYARASIVTAERVVFDICGNRYRLVARINYASGTVFVRFVGTHAEYDRIDVESI